MNTTSFKMLSATDPVDVVKNTLSVGVIEVNGSPAVMIEYQTKESRGIYGGSQILEELAVKIETGDYSQIFQRMGLSKSQAIDLVVDLMDALAQRGGVASFLHERFDELINDALYEAGAEGYKPDSIIQVPLSEFAAHVSSLEDGSVKNLLSAQVLPNLDRFSELALESYNEGEQHD